MFANSKAYCPHRNCNKCPTQRRFCSSSTFFCLCPNLELGVRDNWWFPHIQSFQPKQAEIWRCDVKAHRLERLRHPSPPPAPYLLVQTMCMVGREQVPRTRKNFLTFRPLTTTIWPSLLTHNHYLTKLTHLSTITWPVIMCLFWS